MQQENQSDIFTDLNLDLQGRQYLRSMITWTMIIVIVSVIGYLINIIQALNPPDAIATRTEGFNNPLLQFGGANIVSTLIMTAIGLIINYFLFRFSTQARKSLDGLDQQSFAGSFGSLKNYFMINSIFCIIFIVFICIALVVVLTGVAG